MLALLSRIRRWFVELNLFESGSTDAEVIRQERWSSRFNIILLLIILCGIAMYTALDVWTTHVTVENPSYAMFQSLQSKYSTTLKCPCSNIAIKYETFAQLQVSYHQVCSSSFITEAWIKASYRANTSYIWPMDARTAASSHAQFLRSFCTLSRLSLKSVIIDSLGSPLISPQALPKTLLALKVNEQADVIRSTGPWMLLASLICMRLLVTGNQLISGLGTNTFAYMSPYAPDMPSIDINVYATVSGSICRCDPTINCQVPAAIYSNPVKQTLDIYDLNVNSTLVRGMQTACSPLEGLLSSTLECYYDASCLQLLVPNSTIFVPLNVTQSSRFLPSSKVEVMINELLVEQWLFDYSSEDYFHQCAPFTCGYSYTHRNNFLTISTTIIAIFGGLNAVLRLIIPSFVRRLFKLKRKFLDRKANSSEAAANSAQSVVETRESGSEGKLQWLWIQIKTLNFFDSQSDNPLKARREQHTTRLYIVLLLLISIILFFYVTFTKQTKTYTINRPTQAIYENLHMTYAETIECPCTNVTVTYKKFISIKARYHQICSSGFILKGFIDQLYAFNETTVHRADFMAMSASYFQWIASFCLLCQVVILNLYTSYQTQLFVNTKLLSRDVFTKQTDDIMQSFINSASVTFVRSLSELLELTASSQVLPGSYTSFNLRITSSGNIRIDPAGFDDCSCFLEPKTCSTAAGFYSYDPSNSSFRLLATVPGIRVACLTLLSFLQSNLECWYSADCFGEVIEFWRDRIDTLSNLPHPLNRTSSSRYNTSTLIHTIVENIMIEEWSKEASYSSFFDQCEPSYCTYVINERPNIIIVITILIGVFSGLNIVLKLLVPLIVRALYWCWTYAHSEHNLLQQLRELPGQLLALNLFHHAHKSSVLTIRKEIHITRLYVLLFIAIFTILFLYNVLNEETVTITVQQPSQTTYAQLYASFSSSLQCPCSQISIPYKSFVAMSTTLHQICSSSFIDMPWITSIYGDGDWSNLSANEFRSRGVVYFFVLQSLCTIAKGKITTAGSYLFDKQIISSRVIPENEFLSQINSDIDQLQRSFSSTFITLIQFARDSLQANQMMSVYSLNWIYSPQYDLNMSYYHIPTRPIFHGGNCSCAISSACTEAVFVSDKIIPGFVLGCSSLESLLRSSLSCLYNQSCLDLINIANLSIITPLSNSFRSRFPPDTTVEDIIPDMFIERWSSNVSYPAFFSQCQPLSCSYSESKRKDTLHLVTILLGIYSGLTTVLSLVAPLLISFSSKIVNKFRRSNDAVVPFNQRL